MVKLEPLVYGDRKVFTVSTFNRGVSMWLRKLPDVWVEGELTELRRNDAWASVFFTLKDPQTGATLAATMQRRRFEALALDLVEGERVHVQGRAKIYEQKGELGFHATTIERFGIGDHLAALERLKRALAAEGLFAAERKRLLPRFPRAVGVLTGADAAARGDICTAIGTRFPPARIVVAETRVQGTGAPGAIVSSLTALAAHPQVDVVVVTRGGGSFEDLLPFSDERVVRAFAACPVPVVSAVGHEQDTPLCDLAADVRASTPTAAARLVVPDLDELLAGLKRSRERLAAGLRRLAERDRERLTRVSERLRAAPRLLIERRRAALAGTDGRLRALAPHATLERGYAIVRSGGTIVRDAAETAVGSHIDVELARGSLRATVDEVTRP
jgi:exodeoxyribonuclease VII large subunit